MPNILVVDNERAVADTLHAIFLSAGYLVACAYSGEEAIQKAAVFNPHILLCDVIMPGLNGFEAALQIKRLCPECRLFLFSGDGTCSELGGKFASVFSELGYVFELIPKPIHPTDLLLKVGMRVPTI